MSLIFLVSFSRFLIKFRILRQFILIIKSLKNQYFLEVSYFISFSKLIYINQITFLVPWVDSNRSLMEQGIEEWETLLLKKKFFFSDFQVNESDPIQLNLLYVQVKSL